MIDFDDTGLYKGFVKNQKGKKFPGRNPQLLTLSEVDAFDGFSGIMNLILYFWMRMKNPTMRFCRISSRGKGWLAI